MKVGSSAMRNVCYIADLLPRGTICYIAKLPGEDLLWGKICSITPGITVSCDHAVLEIGFVTMIYL